MNSAPSCTQHNAALRSPHSSVNSLHRLPTLGKASQGSPWLCGFADTRTPRGSLCKGGRIEGFEGLQFDVIAATGMRGHFMITATEFCWDFEDVFVL